MPIVDVRTSASASALVQAQLLEDLVEITSSLLGKAPEVTMAAIQCDQALLFRGNRDPAATIEVRGIGLPEPGALASLAADLSRLLDEVLDIPPARTFVLFEDVPASRWAVGGKLLG